MATENIPENQLTPLPVFKFQVNFFKKDESEVPVCSGAFSECTGLEATMEPKVIKVGGHNYGAIQRSGPVTFATVILKRGMTTTRDLFTWFKLVADGAYAYRLAAKITMFDSSGQSVLTCNLDQALPIKFKAADLNAMGTGIAIEELHLAHEGLTLLASEGRTL